MTSTDNAPPMARTRLGYVPAFDGLRGVAILLVISQHYYRFLSGGFIGVDLFFVLSGFLITTLLLEERHTTGTVSLRAFYGRRARRLLPALVALLVAVTVLTVMPGSGLRGELGDVAAGLFYVANFVRAFGHAGAMGRGPLGHLWSLSEEEQFYLLWPVLLVTLVRVRATRIAMCLTLGIVALCIWRVLLATQGGATPARLMFAPDTRADPLLVGCLIAVLRTSGNIPTWFRQHAGVLGAFGFAGCAYLAATLTGYRISTYTYGLPASELSAGLLIFACVEARSGIATRLLGFRPLVWLGGISYALYLWHLFVHVFVSDPTIAVAVAILVAWLSTRYLEKPFRRQAQADPKPTLQSASSATLHGSPAG